MPERDYRSTGDEILGGLQSIWSGGRGGAATDVGERTQRGGGKRDGGQESKDDGDGVAHEPPIVTPAGIRQALPLFGKAPHAGRDRNPRIGLMDLHTDKGPIKAWLQQVGSTPDPMCSCGETQNATHLIASGCVGGRKRTWEEIWSDPDFCSEVTPFLLSQGKGGYIYIDKIGGWGWTIQPCFHTGMCPSSYTTL